jgi:hypothetical protein
LDILHLTDGILVAPFSQEQYNARVRSIFFSILMKLSVSPIGYTYAHGLIFVRQRTADAQEQLASKCSSIAEESSTSTGSHILANGDWKRAGKFKESMLLWQSMATRKTH